MDQAVEFNLGQCQGPCESSSSRNKLQATKSASGQTTLMEQMDLCKLLHHLELHWAATAMVSCSGRERRHNPARSYSSSHSANSSAERPGRPAMAGLPCLNSTILMRLPLSSCFRNMGGGGVVLAGAMLHLAICDMPIRYRMGTPNVKADVHDTVDVAVPWQEDCTVAEPHCPDFPSATPSRMSPGAPGPCRHCLRTTAK